MLGLTFKEDCPELRNSKLIDIMVKTTAAEQTLNPGLATRRICMATHSFYESDNRIIRYAQALTERGGQVEAVALRRSARLPKRELVNGVLVHRIRDRFGKNEASPWSYLWPLLRFVLVITEGVPVKPDPIFVLALSGAEKLASHPINFQITEFFDRRRAVVLLPLVTRVI